MSHCEMCGAESDSLTTVKISQAELDVCSDCEELGQPVQQSTTTDSDTKYSTGSESESSNKSQTSSQSSGSSSSSKPSLDTTELRPDYGEVIKEAREAQTLTLAELAEEVGEKESHIRKVEHGELRPTETLQHNLEEALNVDLGSESDFDPDELSSTGTGQTLGDVVDFNNE